MHESPKSGRKISENILSQAVGLIETDENDLYETLGLSFTLWESLQGIDLVHGEIEGIVARPPSTEGYQMRLYLRESQLAKSLTLPNLRQDLIRKGKGYLGKHKRKLFQKICVEKEACKWSNEILGDSKSLLREIIPLVGIALGWTIPAVVITIAILIVKWSIIKFCKCPKP